MSFDDDAHREIQKLRERVAKLEARQTRDWTEQPDGMPVDDAKLEAAQNLAAAVLKSGPRESESRPPEDESGRTAAAVIPPAIPDGFALAPGHVAAWLRKKSDERKADFDGHSDEYIEGAGYALRMAARLIEAGALPAEPPSDAERWVDPPFRTCEFCKCVTNARLRACCADGRAADKARRPPRISDEEMEKRRPWPHPAVLMNAMEPDKAPLSDTVTGGSTFSSEISGRDQFDALLSRCEAAEANLAAAEKERDAAIEAHRLVVKRCVEAMDTADARVEAERARVNYWWNKWRTGASLSWEDRDLAIASGTPVPPVKP